MIENKWCALVAVMVLLGSGCLLDKPEESGPIILGNVSLRRDVRDEQRYALTMDVLNESEDVLRSLTFYARVVAPVPAEEELIGLLHTSIPTTVGSGVRVPVTAILQSPFPVVPPVPVTLEDIRIGEFRFSPAPGEEETYTLFGWIRYPWPVEETR